MLRRVEGMQGGACTAGGPAEPLKGVPMKIWLKRAALLGLVSTLVACCVVPPFAGSGHGHGHHRGHWQAPGR
ncbi:MAG: hypothetical protein IPG57_02020 [Burkholderiales bacterium]|nr:hypothetical protein [Burkholderiales bacterium]